MGVATAFHVGFTADFFDDAGNSRYRDLGLSLLERESRVTVRRLDPGGAELTAGQLSGVQGAIVLASRVTAASLETADDLLAIGRFGVGYDNVDVEACTRRNVVLFITANAVDRSVAEATLGWMLALTHHVRAKDRLVREGRWDERSGYMGSELRDRTLGIIGFGGIGRAVVGLLGPFGMRPPLVYDPYVSQAAVEACGARQVSLDELLSQSDFVSLHCPLNEKTRNLLGARELALMQPHAWFLNTARGGIVDEEALFAALSQGRIAGAAIDCFVGEPLRAAPRFAELDNVLLAPHCIAWTNELFRDIGRMACQGMLDLVAGRRPRGVVNPAVFEQAGFQAKWKRWQPLS